MEREEEQLLGPRVASVTGGVGRWPATITALSETSNMRLDDDDDVRAREEEKVRASASGENEGDRELLWA